MPEGRKRGGKNCQQSIHLLSVLMLILWINVESGLVF